MGSKICSVGESARQLSCDATTVSGTERLCGINQEKIDNHSYTLQKSKSECLLQVSHQKGTMMIIIVKTLGSQVGSPAAEEEVEEVGGEGVKSMVEFMA